MSEELPPPEMIWRGKTDPLREFEKPEKFIKAAEPDNEPDGEGPYTVVREDPLRAFIVVSRRDDLGEAKARAAELACENPAVKKMLDLGLGLEFRWITVNNGTEPGNVQVYELRLGTNHTDFGVRGPHVGENS
jgi:hypothetical protein